MQDQDSQDKTLAVVVHILCAVGIFAGCAIEIGWLGGIEILKNPMGADAPIKINSGLCFLLSGVSILMLSYSSDKTSWYRRAAMVGALVVFLTGILTISEHVWGVNLGIDQLFARDSEEVIRAYAPGRMSLNASIYFALLGLSVLLIDRKERLLRSAQQWIAVVMWLMTTLAIVGYGYGFRELYNYGAINPLRFPSAIAFYCLGIAAFLVRPHSGPAAIYGSRTTAGAIARTLGLAGILLPALTFISGINRRTEIDLAVVAFLLFVGFPIAVWAAARRLEKSDQERLQIYERFEQFMSNLPGLAMLLDADGRAVYINGDAQKVLDLKLGEKNLTDLPTEAARQLDDLNRKVLEEGQRVETVRSVRTTSGETRTYFAVRFPVDDARGRLIGIVGLDITEQQRAEQTIRELNDALEAQVHQLLTANLELEATRDAALESARAKSDFLDNISHELRTPIAGILGTIELVPLDGLSAENQELLRMANESAVQLLATVESLLDFSNLEAGKLRLQEHDFSIAAMVDTVLSAIKPMANKKNICVIEEVEPQLPSVRGDAGKLRHILLNLATNAVKFTDKGCVLLRVSAGDQVNDILHLQFTVSDTGIGISPEERARLFLPFSQVDTSHSRKYGGTGLGLVITKKLVELMGGTFGVSSIKGKGSTFWCTIPLVAASPQSVQLEKPHMTMTGSQPTSDPDQEAGSHEAQLHNYDFVPILAGCDVLLVEDNEALQQLSRQQLESLGLRAEIAGSGQEALEAVAKHRYSVVLMDCQLPVMDGFEAAKRIREVDQSMQRHTPIIAMTTSITPDETERCRMAGMDDYLAKPISTEELAEKMAIWVKQ